ncbi:RxLR effector protein [Phytophthora megakarya]|uniref:RxLR effector protein n=1 Tax=Phytophthora megakarya TaxID=4795 RepID=A0A225VP51_9STRA|nr:RxLR effector protein [Phytophthora megakarya]
MGARHSELSPADMAIHLGKFVQIPKNRRVQTSENSLLMGPISEEEVLDAIKGLQRNKAGGEDGLNNDFYLDCAEGISAQLAHICNTLLDGQPPPKSFLKAVVVPLRKKGDSPNALDYRPISLLQSSYKIFAKILASRLQTFLGRIIGDTQQGFVHGRQMHRSVAMMLAMLQQDFHDPNHGIASSPGIVLLDFAKAYDTVDRVFLLEVLRRFGFSADFVDLMDRMHDGTTAQFLVNGELSPPLEVRSGIRQGCPLAPLLFILAVEVLALAIAQSSEIEGLQVPGADNTEQHKFSGFVDDSTLFLQEGRQLEAALGLIQDFGKISGLKVQPAKSCFIPLNRAVEDSEFLTIPVLKEGHTTKYLGYEIGFGKLAQANWAHRIRAVQRRMVTAEAAATTVVDRVDLFNTIVMPALLFTAKWFPPPQEVLTQLINMQKQFVWRRQMKDDPSRHKMTPQLIFTPRRAGGLGLIDIPVAIQTQRVNSIMIWLISARDRYQQAWRYLSGLLVGTVEEPAVTPRRSLRKRRVGPSAALERNSRREVGELLAPAVTEEVALIDYVRMYLPGLIDTAAAHTPQPMLQPAAGDTIQVEADFTSIPHHKLLSPEYEAFWGTFAWAENPWIPELAAPFLSRAKYDKLQVTSIKGLGIVRKGITTYEMRLPLVVGKGHTVAKLTRLILAVLLSSPRIGIGEKLGELPPLKLRHAPEDVREVSWTVQADRTVRGTLDNGGEQILATQRPDGLYWDGKVIYPVIGTLDNGSEQILATQRPDGLYWDGKVIYPEAQALESGGEDLRGMVFEAHPLLHSFPWRANERQGNRHLWAHLKKTVKRWCRGRTQKTPRAVLHKWAQERLRDSWISGLQSQTPEDLWSHKDTLTAYQV